jgi:hypothetical protein
MPLPLSPARKKICKEKEKKKIKKNILRNWVEALEGKEKTKQKASLLASRRGRRTKNPTTQRNTPNQADAQICGHAIEPTDQTQTTRRGGEGGREGGRRKRGRRQPSRHTHCERRRLRPDPMRGGLYLRIGSGDSINIGDCILARRRPTEPRRRGRPGTSGSRDGKGFAPPPAIGAGIGVGIGTLTPGVVVVIVVVVVVVAGRAFLLDAGWGHVHECGEGWRAFGMRGRGNATVGRRPPTWGAILRAVAVRAAIRTRRFERRYAVAFVLRVFKLFVGAALSVLSVAGLSLWLVVRLSLVFPLVSLLLRRFGVDEHVLDVIRLVDPTQHLVFRRRVLVLAGNEVV